MARKASSKSPKDSTATIGFEAKLWLAADSRGEAEPEQSGDSQPQAALRANAVRQTAEGNRSNNMDAAEPERSGDSQPQAARRASEARQYKHVVLGLIFLKYISDTFEEHRAKLLAGEGDYAGANPEDPDEPNAVRQTMQSIARRVSAANQYKAENVFWVPADARWPHLQASAKQPTIGKTVDDAMVAIECDWQMSNAEVRMWN